MDVREKLVELLFDSLCRHIDKSCNLAENIADDLIRNGVTVQEWIPVDDRLPEPKENAICLNGHWDVMIGTYTELGWMFPCYFEKPTYWMPLPPLPKGE